MQHFYIDGYNLFFRTIRTDPESDFKSQREKIIREIATKIQQAGMRATLVFDSQFKQGPRERHSLRELEIHYTDEGQTADDYILETLRRCARPREETVVTSDKRLAWFARLKGANTVNVEDFLKILDRISRKKMRTQKEAPMPKTVPKHVLKRVTLEEHYEKLFQEMLEKGEMPSEPKESKKRKSAEQQENKESKNDFERWLDAFQREVGENNDGA